jgi:ribosomal protein S18 acetylase RimI-like enzyme
MASSSHMLDNLTWYAMTGLHTHLTIGTKLAKRYIPEISIAVAVANHSETAFAELAQIVPTGEMVALAETHPPESLPGWQIHDRFEADQMVCQQDVSEPFTTEGIITLTVADVPDMIELIDAARPGPFTPRSIEMGRFFGIRQDGKLVAMAGERFRLPDYCEISTVCTHPDWQGNGYARRLCSLLIHDNWQKGIIPFLHVNPENSPALRLYESLHFTRRDSLKVVVISHE